MSGRKSTASVGEAVAPKRRRGRDRVAAILEAATALFAEKGYAAATMTEIAVRSSTAIGSLYRFFPTKEALAATLIERYGARLIEALDAIVGEAAVASPAVTAEALVDLVQRLKRERSAALALVELSGDGPALRRALSGAMRDRLAAILARLGASPAADDDARATLLLHLLKTAWALEDGDPARRAALDREARLIVRLYLEATSAARRAPA